MTLVIPQRLRRGFPKPNALIQEARERQARRRHLIIAFGLALAVCCAVGYGVTSGLSRSQPLVTCAAGRCAAATLPNPCKLIANSDMVRVLGGPVGGRQTGPAAGSCTWAGPTYHRSFGPPSQPMMTVTVYRQGEAQFRRDAEVNDVPLRGVGVPAYYKTGGVEFLRVWRDGYTITFMSMVNQPSLTSLERLARLTVQHLP